MIKLKWIYFLLIFSLGQLQASDSIHVIQITYEVYIENVDSLSTYKYKLPYETVHIVSPDKVIALDKYAADIDEVHMYDLESKLEYQYYFKDEEKKIAVKEPLQQIPTLVTNVNDEKHYQVGGMRCKKYEIVHKNSTIEIYTTDAFGVNFTPFNQLKGYAMQYTFIDDVYGRVTYSAKSIYPTIADKATFSLDGFEIKDEAFPADMRNSFDEILIAKESSSLFKLNKKKIGFKFKLSDGSKVTEKSCPDSLVVLAMCGFNKLTALDKELMNSMINSMKDKKVKFYYFALKQKYSKQEIADLRSVGFEVAYLKETILSKFKIQYYPTYLLLDKDRKVIKYKIGTNSSMLNSFREKIIELNDA